MEGIEYIVRVHFRNNRIEWLDHKTSSLLVYCTPPGYTFICQVDKKRWTTNCLHSNSMSTQYMLATLVTPSSIHSLSEFKFIKPVYSINSRFTWWHPRWRRLFLWVHLVTMVGVVIHQHVLQNLSVTLTTIAKYTTCSLTNLQKSLDSLAKVLFDNHLALVYQLAEQGGLMAVANISCCTYISTSSQVQTNIEKTQQQATWLQQTINHQSSLFSMGGEIESCFSNLFSWIPQGIRIFLMGCFHFLITFFMVSAILIYVKCLVFLS